MKAKKVILIVIMAVFIVLIGLIINLFVGNPISKEIARSNMVKFFENTYKEKFNVYRSEYNFKIPGYIFYMGPKKDANVRFDTALYVQGITDPYGEVLASQKLSDDLTQVLLPDFNEYKLKVTAQEDPLVSYAGERADYFEIDPSKRVQKNHYFVEIIWKDNGMNSQEFTKAMEEMRKTIENQLPYVTPNLSIKVVVKDKQNTDLTVHTEEISLFSTNNPKPER